MLERWRLAEAIGVHFSVETLGELLHISGSHINSCMYDINISLFKLVQFVETT
jgi:hypothetical protein